MMLTGPYHKSVRVDLRSSASMLLIGIFFYDDGRADALLSRRISKPIAQKRHDRDDEKNDEFPFVRFPESPRPLEQFHHGNTIPSRLRQITPSV